MIFAVGIFVILCIFHITNIFVMPIIGLMGCLVGFTLSFILALIAVGEIKTSFGWKDKRMWTFFIGFSVGFCFNYCFIEFIVLHSSSIWVPDFPIKSLTIVILISFLLHVILGFLVKPFYNFFNKKDDQIDEGWEKIEKHPLLAKKEGQTLLVKSSRTFWQKVLNLKSDPPIVKMRLWNVEDVERLQKLNVKINK